MLRRLVSRPVSRFVRQMASQSPHWHTPSRDIEPGEPQISVYNSLTRSVQPFITNRPGIVDVYTCGPTVYDHSHLGHARNYIAQDILRRILRDYFNYDVNFTMNITDIDDKIILRARHTYLVDELRQKVQAASVSPEDVVSAAKSGWTLKAGKVFSAKFDSFDDAVSSVNAQRSTDEEEELRSKNHSFTKDVSSLRESLGVILSIGTSSGKDELTHLVDTISDGLALYLDKTLGHTVTDPQIFRDLAAHWEGIFFESMGALNVEKPDMLLRVSEYVPEIVSFVQRIIERGHAYESNGSVWFDVAKFEADKGSIPFSANAYEHYFYAKLQPWSKNNVSLLDEGEGSLTNTQGKRSSADFALWKASKPGEPAWPSPWGGGRPGWHIECSVMASSVFGSNFDVHLGGQDLTFPHHDNEMAQSESFHGCAQWVNYYLHIGLLNIEGLKMSKSLKNFLTVNEVLEMFTWRQLRIVILLYKYNAPVDFKTSTLTEAKSVEATFDNFFIKVKALAQRLEGSELDLRRPVDERDVTFTREVDSHKSAIRRALSSSLDHATAFRELLAIVSRCNVYLLDRSDRRALEIVLSVEKYISNLLSTFGLTIEPRLDIGWGDSSLLNKKSTETVSSEAVARPYVTAASRFRDEIRAAALDGKPAKDILSISDDFRNKEMLALNVSLDDQPDGHALVKFLTQQQTNDIIAEREALKQTQEKARIEKAARAEEARKKQQQRLEAGRTPPQDLFKTAEFSEWDADGLPSKDSNGEELPKSRRKKLAKQLAAQQELHEEFLRSQQTT